MKKILLGLAVLLGFSFAASAETVVLNFNDAADIKGTKDASSGNYAPVESFKVGDFSFVCGFDKEGVLDTQKPKLWQSSGTFGEITTEWQVRIFSSAQGWFTITAPEGATMSKIVAYGPSGNLSTSASVSADSGKVVMDSNSTTKIGTATWTGSASAVKFTASTGKPQIAYMEVTYEKAAQPGGDFTASFVPESGQTLKEISTLEVNWNVSCNGISNGCCDMNTLYKKNGEDWATVENYWPAYDAETGKVSFSFMTVGVDPKPFSTPGEYKFVIPAGKFWLNNVKTAEEIMDDWENVGNSPEVVYYFTIKEGAPVVDAVDFGQKVISSYPGEEISAAEYWEDGSVSVMYEINGALGKNSACTDAIVMTLDGAPFGNRITVDSEFLQVVDGSDVSPLAEGDDDEVISQLGLLFFMPETSAKPLDGLYEMTIPAGFFTIDGAPVKEYKTSWRVGAAPAENVNMASYIVMLEPGQEMTPEERWDGSIDVMMQLSATVAKNTASTGKAVMKRDGAIIGNELAIDSEFVIVQADDASPLAEGDEASALTNVMLVFLQDENFKAAPGTYEMTIPAGFFSINGAPNAVYTKTWEIKRVITGEYGTTPDNNETVTKKIDEFSVEFPAATTVTGVTTGVTVKNEAGTDFAPFGTLPAGNKLTFFYTTGLENGTYTVTIPANTLTVDGTPYATEITWTFTIAVPEAEKPVINPAEGKVAPTDLDVITITYPAGTTIVVAEDPFVTLSAGMSMTMYTTQLGESANIVKFTRQNSEELAEGDVTFTIYGGAYTVNGTANEMMTFNYTISKAPAIVINKPAITPAEGELFVDDVNTFTLTPADNLKATKVNADAQVVLVNVAVNAAPASYAYKASLGENGEVVLTKQGEEEIAAGEYKLVVPAGTFSVGDVESPEFTYNFTLKTNSVDTVFAGETEFNVYSATGILLIRNGNADDVDALAPGLYIINGKKVLIRK